MRMSLMSRRDVETTIDGIVQLARTQPDWTPFCESVVRSISAALGVAPQSFRPYEHTGPAFREALDDPSIVLISPAEFRQLKKEIAELSECVG